MAKKRAKLKSHPKDRKLNEVLEDIKYISYYDLDKNKKRMARKLSEERIINSFTYSINPKVIEKIHPGVNRYIAFIDSRRADCYRDLKKYLIDNHNKYNSFFTAGDSDFVILFTADDNSFNRLYDKLLEIHRSAPKEGQMEELFQIYEIKKYHKLAGKSIGNEDPDLKNILQDLEYLSKIDITLQNYMAPGVKKIFGSDVRVKSFLKELEEKNILHNYYITRNFIPINIRAYILILYAQTGFQSDVLKDKNIISRIVDFYDVSYKKSVDEFYKQVKSVIVAEFNNMQEYHEWKEYLYNVLLERNQNINVMTFVVEGIISELPIRLGNYVAFHELCEKYINIPEENKVFVGYPILGSIEEKNVVIPIDLHALNGHGLIIGEPHQGKTTTAVAIAKRLLVKGKRIHVIDSTGGLKLKLEELIPRDRLSTEVKYVDIERIKKQGKLLFKGMPIAINVYNPEEADLYLIIEMLLHAIPTEDTKDRETNDVIMIEEAHGIFSNHTLVDLLFTKMRTAGRQGVCIILSTHNISDIPTKQSGQTTQSLLDYIKNALIHKISESEVNGTIEYLSKAEEVRQLYDLKKELVKLKPGQVFVSFQKSLNRGGEQLPPIKIRVKKEG